MKQRQKTREGRARLLIIRSYYHSWFHDWLFSMIQLIINRIIKLKAGTICMDRWKFEIMRHSWREHYRWIGKYVILVLCILQRQCYWFIGHLLVGSIFSPFIRVYNGSWRCPWRSVGYRKVLTYRCKKKIDLATSVGNERLDEQKWNRLTCYVFMFLYQMINLGVLSLV